MKFLLDVTPSGMSKVPKATKERLVLGQLHTPITRHNDCGMPFGIDNGAFSHFNGPYFQSCLKKHSLYKDRCIFVAMPDVVGNARRTLELWKYRDDFIGGWPMALVMQDGIEDFDIPWDELSTIFIGGMDPWKDSEAVVDIIKTAKILGKHIHVGRVNTTQRFIHFEDLGADTCDGSAVSKVFSQKLEMIMRNLPKEKK